jgi:hypothetical protein
MNHREAWDLIPWLVNGSLDDPRRADMELHLAECALCRDEAHVQGALMQAMNARTQVEAMPRASLQRLWERVDAGESGERLAPVPPRRALGFNWRIAAAMAMVLLGAGVLAVLKPWQEASPAEYRTVTDAATAPAAAGIRAVFAGDTTVAELQALLEQTGMRVVAGPTASGVYTLAANAGKDPQGALAVLRAHPSVRFAEATSQ